MQNNVLALRESLGLTQFEFADYCNISRNSVARFETGGKISRSCAEKIASACGVSVSFVIGDTNSFGKMPPEIKKLLTNPDLASPALPDFSMYTVDEKKAPANDSGLDEELIRELMDLSPAEVLRVRDFLAGLKARREA